MNANQQVSRNSRMPLKNVSNSILPTDRIVHKSVAALRGVVDGSSGLQVNAGKVQLARSPIGPKTSSRLQSDRSPMQGKTPSDMKRASKKSSAVTFESVPIADLSTLSLSDAADHNLALTNQNPDSPTMSFKAFAGKISPFLDTELGSGPSMAPRSVQEGDICCSSPSDAGLSRFALLCGTPSSNPTNPLVSSSCDEAATTQLRPPNQAAIGTSTAGTDDERAAKREEARAKREAARARKLAAAAAAEAEARRAAEAAAALRASADDAMEAAAGGAPACDYSALAAERTVPFELIFACRRAAP